MEWGGEFYCRDKAAKKGAERAQKALEMGREERLKKLSAKLHDESMDDDGEGKLMGREVGGRGRWDSGWAQC